MTDHSGLSSNDTLDKHYDKYGRIPENNIVEYENKTTYDFKSMKLITRKKDAITTRKA